MSNYLLKLLISLLSFIIAFVFILLDYFIISVYCSSLGYMFMIIAITCSEKGDFKTWRRKKCTK